MDGDILDFLHPEVRQLVLNLGWRDLYPIQKNAIREFAASKSDLIICAPTAGGKSEAAYLPLVSDILARGLTGYKSVCALVVSPLRALINDQYIRLAAFCESLGVPVHRWHGDVAMETKRRLRDRPSGILLVTPESLESLHGNYAHRIVPMFCDLQYVVIDELHAVLENERGAHVRSLLSRVYTAIGRRPRILALSATLGDPLAARSFLNADHPDSVKVIADRSTARAIAVQVVSFTDQDEDEDAPINEDDEHGCKGILGKISEDLRNAFEEGSVLIFANSRRKVEELGDLFRGEKTRKSANQPAVALHHGSLSAPLRKTTETLLKSGHPTRAFCTSSLELGIDIGAIDSVAQIDAPWSVASLAQRLGRSGRKLGSTSKLRLYVRLPSLGRDPSLVDLLHPQLLRSITVVRLLLSGWLEPTRPDRVHLSTLTHQILSVLKEKGSQTALALYDALCRRGPFRRVEPADFKVLLIGLGKHDLIAQDDGGAIFLGTKGESITAAPSFYAAFATPIELTVRWGAKELGRLPATELAKQGQCLLLDGRRWLIKSVDWKSKTIWVSPTEIRKATLFLGGGGEIHDRIIAEMRNVLLEADEPSWLDATSLGFLQSARAVAREAGLDKTQLLELDEGIQWFPWVGSRTAKTLCLWGQAVGLDCAKDQLSLTFQDISLEHLEAHLADLAEHGTNPLKLAQLMPSKHMERFDVYLDEQLLDKANANDRLDVASARAAARHVIEAISTT